MPEGGSQGPRGCVEPIITSEVWCYDIISQQSQRESEREGKRERDVHICHKCQFYWYEKERENIRGQ
jgi:hypothetical protein